MTLREMRAAAGFSQEEVGKEMNVDQAAVSNWERGKSGISRKYHKKLAQLYGRTVDELLNADKE